MRNRLTILFLFLASLLSAATDNTALGWKTYLSYTTTNSVEESADQVFVVATGSLYTYGKEDNSIKQYQKGIDLNDNEITLIRYNKQTQSLLIVYKNSNIDILEGGSVRNLPYLSNSTTLRNKQVNSITLHNEYAYLSTGFGIMVVNMAKKEITDTYNLSRNITSCAIQNGAIYASIADKNEVATGMCYASLTDNLLDKSNWKTYSIPGIPDDYLVSGMVSFKNTLYYLVKNKGVFYQNNGSFTALASNGTMTGIKDLSDKLACMASSTVYLFTDTNNPDQVSNLNIKDISTYQTDKFWIAEGEKGLRSIKKNAPNSFEATSEPLLLDGPYMNSPYKVLCTNDKVYVIPGGKVLTAGTRFGLAGWVMIYDYTKWSYLDPTDVQKKVGNWPTNFTSIVVKINEANEESIFTSSFGGGLYQYINGEPVKRYYEENSPLANAGGNKGDYNRVDGLAYDKNGNLWMTNSEVQNGISVLDKDGKWHSIYSSYLSKDVFTINDILITSNQDKWINVPRAGSKVVVLANNSSLDEATSYEFSSFTDTDGNSFAPSNYTCLAEDKKGYVWIGTNKGPVYLTNPKGAASDKYASTRCTRVKLINEEDGSPFYFLDNVIITTIKVDQANRKWIGTEGSGVYVLDGDNQQVVHQFNPSNSPLPSDKIYSIDINNKTGEVFIGTDKGLASYKGEATEGKKDYSDIYAFPNPVRPEQMDKVTITGLMENSNIKITDLSGNIIYQTKSLGGQATWNCRNKSGVRVATGVYLVLAATEDSSESVVTKIAVIK